MRCGNAAAGAWATACALMLLAGEAAAQNLTQVCNRPSNLKLVRADLLEQKTEEQYARWLDAARGHGALALPGHPQVQRLRYIVGRIAPFAEGCNERARDWKWPIGLIDAPLQPARGLPGGRLVVVYRTLSELQLDDDEVAALLSHAMAEALLEFERERLVQQAGVELLLNGGAALLGMAALAPSTEAVAKATELRLVREQMLRADKLGLWLTAQAGYRPEAFVSLWKKVRQAQPPGPAMLQRHVPLEAQLSALERDIPGAAAWFLQAQRPDQRFSPPAPTASPAVAPASSPTN